MRLPQPDRIRFEAEIFLMKPPRLPNFVRRTKLEKAARVASLILLTAFFSAIILRTATADPANPSLAKGTSIPAAATPIPQRAVLANLSARAFVGKGENALIGGFIITGDAPKRVIVRSLGPSLPLTSKLANPNLALYGPGSALLGSNSDWVNSPDSQAINNSGLAPRNNSEAAVLATLAPKGYTGVVYGEGASDTAIGLVEIYDLEPDSNSELANLSARGLVQSGDNVLIGGFIISGQGTLRVVVRALGPSLALNGALPDPTLEIRDENGALLASNDNWHSDQAPEIMATNLSPTNDAESATVQRLTPGLYTAIVRGAHQTTGLALVEIYALN